MRSLVPSTASLARAPYEVGCQLHPGSALRLSQPLSGFLASTKFVALFHATASSWDPPFRVFPSQRARTPLGVACFPAVIHRRSKTHRSTPCRSRFPRRPHSRAVAWFLRKLWAPFPRTRMIASRLPWVSNSEAASSRRLHLPRSLLPPANPFVLCPGCPEQSSRYSPGFPPL